MEIKVQTIPAFLTYGRLGAVVDESMSRDSMQNAAIDMAERRIIRLEEALRKAGVNIDDLEF